MASGCRPNYNSVVATFCHNIARGLPIQVRDPGIRAALVYIDDRRGMPFGRAANWLGRARTPKGSAASTPVHRVTLGALPKRCRTLPRPAAATPPRHWAPTACQTLAVPALAGGSLEKKLYSTYLSYLPEDGFAYDLNMHCDARGSFY